MYRRLPIALLPSMLTAFLLPAAAQPPLAWEASYDGPAGSHDALVALAVDGNGRVYAAGTTYDPVGSDNWVLLCYSPSGALSWEAIYAGPNQGLDRLTSLALTDQGPILSGTSTSSTERLVVTRAYGWDGSLSWHADFVVTTSSPFGYLTPATLGIAPDGDVVVGTQDGADMRVLRYGQDGTLEWTVVYDGPLDDDDGFFDVGVDSTGAVALTGSLGPFGEGTIVVRYDANGVYQWEHQTLGNFGGLVGPSYLEIGSDDKIVVTSTHETFCGVFEYRSIQLSPDGTLDWEVAYHGPEACDSSDPAGNVVAPDGTVIVTGSGITPETTEFQDIVTIAYDGSGDEVWLRDVDLPGASVDVAQTIAISSDTTPGSWAAYVTAISVISTYFDSVLMKYEADGTVGWMVDLIAPNGALFSGDSVAAQEERIAVGGIYYPPGSPSNIVIQVFGSLGDANEFVRADCNGDGGIDIGDAVQALSALFEATLDPPCIDACDSNDDGAFDIADPIYTLAYLFTSASPPTSPYPGCGEDPTVDALPCGPASCATP